MAHSVQCNGAGYRRFTPSVKPRGSLRLISLHFMYGSPIRDVNHNITISRQPGALCAVLFHVFDMFLKSLEFLA